MKTMKGPALFLAQFAGDEAPFNSWTSICKWAADCGYEGVQVPSWDARLIDLDKAADSVDYCQDWAGQAAEQGVTVTELACHLQGQLVAVHPAYDIGFDGFAHPSVHGDPKARQAWAVDQVGKTIRASRNLGLNALGSFSGALAWPYMYPWPQRPAGLVETAFDELAKRWRPLLDLAEENGVDICYEIHPGEDLHDGVTFEMFLERVNNHARAKMLYDPSHYVLQCLDYLDNLDIYADRIGMFHVKDAEFNPTGRQGVYGGYQSCDRRQAGCRAERYPRVPPDGRWTDARPHTDDPSPSRCRLHYPPARTATRRPTIRRPSAPGGASGGPKPPATACRRTGSDRPPCRN